MAHLSLQVVRRFRTVAGQINLGQLAQLFIRQLLQQRFVGASKILVPVTFSIQATGTGNKAIFNEINT
jgi:hypothetical protein